MGATIPPSPPDPRNFVQRRDLPTASRKNFYMILALPSLSGCTVGNGATDRFIESDNGLPGNSGTSLQIDGLRTLPGMRKGRAHCVNIFDVELDKKDSERRIHPVQQTQRGGDRNGENQTMEMISCSP